MEKKYSLVSTARLLLGMIRMENRRFKLMIAGVLVIQLIAAQFEIFSIAALVPVLSMTLGSDKASPHELIRWVANVSGVSIDDLAVVLCFAFLLSIALASLFRILNLVFQRRLAASLGTRLATRFFSSTLEHDYLARIQAGQSTLISQTMFDMNIVIGAMTGLFGMALSAITLGLILTAILIYNFGVSITIALGTAMFYAVVDKLLRRHVVAWGKIQSLNRAKIMTVLRDAYAHSIDVILVGARDVFVSKFWSLENPIRTSTANIGVASAAPRFVLEIALVIVISATVSVMLSAGQPFPDVLSTIAIIGFAFVRMVPAAQQLYGAVSGLRSAGFALDRVVKMIEREPDELYDASGLTPISIRENVSVENVWFRYGGRQAAEGVVGRAEQVAAHDQWTLRGINVTCRRGEITAITGETGSGKSTVANIFATLLRPTKGCLVLDGQNMSLDTLKRWRKTVAYVPQTIHASDTSVTQNIAFGQPEDEIDMSKVRDAANRAQILEFVDSLPFGFDTRLGDDGAWLSGGQRQRLSIARAIYRGAKFLILDEATSSLDNRTEKAVMDAIYGLEGEVTVLIIAHRLSTIKRASRIYHLDAGAVASSGSFDELLTNSESFRTLVQASSDERQNTLENT